MNLNAVKEERKQKGSIADLEELLSTMVTTEETKYKCDVCEDTGFIINKEERTLANCACSYKSDRVKILQKFKATQPIRFKTDQHENRRHQVAIQSQLLLEKGCWLFGESSFGKTHLARLAILRRLEYAADDKKRDQAREKFPHLYIKTFIKAEVIKATDLDKLWVDQYGDESARAKLRLKAILEADILLIDDFDKLGNITAARQREIFGIIDTLADLKRIVYITSNKSMKDFVSMMETERAALESGGVTPLLTRLEELCTEIHCVKDSQLTIK